MGSLFKKQYTKPLPTGAEVFQRNGQRMARWRDRRGKTRTAPLTTNEGGRDRLLCEAGAWYGRFRDHTGVVVERSTGCRDQGAARQVLARWERNAERIKSGVMTPAEEQMSRQQAAPLENHFDAFLAHLRASDTTPIHQADTLRYLRRLADDCRFTRLADLNREVLERWLSQQEQEGMSARSRNAYRNALVAFGNWCVDAKRLPSNPIAGAPKANEKADPRRRRRAMSEDELVRLLDVARERPLLEALTVRKGKRSGERYANVRPEVRQRLELLGRERALIYKTLVLTGLRKNELATLTAGRLSLDGDVCFAELEAADEKSREGNSVAIRADLADDLRRWLTDKLARLQADARANGEPIPLHLPPDTRLFTVPAGLRRILDRDLKLAGIAKRDERGRTLDVHALRHTFGTLLSKGGVAPRTAQSAMRHSTIDLTMNVYTDPRLLDVHGALDALPGLPLSGDRLDAGQATGTDGGPANDGQPAARKLALRLAETGCKPGQPLSSADNGTALAMQTSLNAMSCPDKRNDSLSTSDSESSCRGDWIRTSDLLNPIQEVCRPYLHLKSQTPSIQQLRISKLSMFYRGLAVLQGWLQGFQGFRCHSVPASGATP
jgi:integrase